MNLTTKSQSKKEDLIRGQYEEPGPSFLRIMVSEQLIEEEHPFYHKSNMNTSFMNSPIKDHKQNYNQMKEQASFSPNFSLPEIQ
jgi:hypothetical protein